MKLNNSVSIISNLSGFSYKNCFIVIIMAGIAFLLSYIFKSFIDDDNVYDVSSEGLILNKTPSIISYASSFISLGLIVVSISLLLIGVINIGPRAVSDFRGDIHSSTNGFIRNMVGEESITATSETLSQIGIKGSNLKEVSANAKRYSDNQTRQFKRELRQAADMIKY